MPGSLPAVNSQQAKYAAYGTDYGGEYQHVLLLHSTLPPNCLPSNKVFVFRYTPWA
ncbi:hypothetical protein EBAG_05143 [Escherichia coli T426]|nr:hypothetical protein EBAG_05143 [Escherichia coli T426]